MLKAAVFVKPHTGIVQISILDGVIDRVVHSSYKNLQKIDKGYRLFYFMGLLQSILGSPSPPDESESKPMIDLPKDEYTVVYPVAVRRSQLTAFQTVIEAEQKIPRNEGPGTGLLTDALDDTWKETVPGDKTWQESMEETRTNAKDTIKGWLKSTHGELNVVFLPANTTFRLEAFLVSCETRADIEEDPFTLPDEFVEAVSLLKALRTAEDEKEPVFVHQDQLPN
ncbi:hypothetical protein [Natranaeroarchaeum aerophilus]|uniref:Uncharacterized protein n=1 Tax=Natranaeroarchaeum aerophilus TaxID=2917711 RepID=A0AAE3FTX3_9EURY|nr:hypothetical protein [Natranaeroarchaeum aerophilus]MCL9815289.1 hypothetical protein [Natranaeroarchaeum aerophilus]